MIKILHAADLHLDSAFAGHETKIAAKLKGALRTVPEKIVSLCKREKCDLLLLAGDLFDGEYTEESFLALKNALEEVQIPTFIAPGNHDFCTPGSPWQLERWPKNVHIFKKTAIESVSLPELDCRIYGAGFSSMDCDSLLEGFRTQGQERYHIGLFHGDPMNSGSPYNPISHKQVTASGLDYLALGHIHKTGAFRDGKTLCAWPGCPMGRGFDELGEKGVLLVAMEESTTLRFEPLDVPRFYDWDAEVLTDARAAIAEGLPAVGNDHFYRITLTGECEKPDLQGLYQYFSAFANLELRDKTRPVTDVWGSAGADCLEGVYFKMLHEIFEEENDEAGQTALLAARISRRILDGSEVVLP